MNFNRLTLTGNDQSIGRDWPPNLSRIQNPLPIDACRNSTEIAPETCNRNFRGNLPNQSSPPRAADGPHSRR
jgi:hypothetical protein